MTQPTNPDNNNNLTSVTYPPIRQTIPLTTLPKDLLQYIFSMIDKLSDLPKIQRTCKRFHQIMQDPITQKIVFGKFSHQFGWPFIDVASFKVNCSINQAISKNRYIFKRIPHEGYTMCSLTNGDCIFRYVAENSLSETDKIQITSLNGSKPKFDQCQGALSNLDYLRMILQACGKNIKINDRGTNKLISELIRPEESQSQIFSTHDSQKVIIVNRYEDAKLLDVQTGKIDKLPKLQHSDENYVINLSFAADYVYFEDKIYVTQNDDIYIFDYKTGQQSGCLKGHSDDIRKLLLLPDGKLVSSAYDKTIKIWDLTTNTCLKTLSTHDDINRLASFHGHLAVLTYELVLQIWDIHEGKCLLVNDCKPIFHFFESHLNDDDVEEQFDAKKIRPVNQQIDDPYEEKAEGPDIDDIEQYLSEFIVLSNGKLAISYDRLGIENLFMWDFSNSTSEIMQIYIPSNEESEEDLPIGTPIATLNGKDEESDDEVSNNNNTDPVATTLDTSAHFNIPTLENLKKWGISDQFFEEFENLQMMIDQCSNGNLNPNAAYEKLLALLTSVESLNDILNTLITITLNPNELLKIKRVQKLKNKLEEFASILRKNTITPQQVATFFEQRMEREIMHPLIQLTDELNCKK